MPKLIKKWNLKIWNWTTEQKKVPKDAAFVGRPSSFGNPWSIGKGMTREKSIKKYIEYLKLNTKVPEMAKKYLKGKDLICFCQPEKCHAEILMDIANG